MARALGASLRVLGRRDVPAGRLRNATATFRARKRNFSLNRGQTRAKTGTLPLPALEAAACGRG
jgi:hypothetical protein